MRKKRHLRHIHLEALKKLKLFYISPRAFVKLNLDNGHVYKKVIKMLQNDLFLQYNVITKRGGHIENMQLRALFGLRPPAVPLTSF